MTVSDHGLNASTFAARVVASTRAGLTSAVLAGLSALKGPLHGGAPGPVIDDAGRDRERRRSARLDRARRRPRRPADGLRPPRLPRARPARRRAEARAAAARQLGGDRPGGWPSPRRWSAAALAVLRDAKPDRSLETNVEFYTALLLEALGFPPAAFTCVFAMGRVAGWIAHAREQLAAGRLIRPQSRYIGPRTDLAA